jgi:hypothetical protein
VGLRLAQGPCLGVGLAFLSESALSFFDGDFMVPRLIMIGGGGLSLLFSTSIRMLFPPAPDQLQGANAPAYWLERPGGSDGGHQAVMLLALAGGAVMISLAVLVVYRLWKQ